MPASTPPRDPGLQAERSRLAGVRTGLALALGLLAMARLHSRTLGLVGWGAAVAGLVVLAVTVGLDQTGRASPAVRMAGFAGVVALLGVLETTAVVLT